MRIPSILAQTAAFCLIVLGPTVPLASAEILLSKRFGPGSHPSQTQFEWKTQVELGSVLPSFLANPNAKGPYLDLLVLTSDPTSKS